MASERPVQRKFRFGRRSALFALVLLLLLVTQQLWTGLLFVRKLPQLGPRTVALTLIPVALDAGGFGPLELAGAWRLGADDSRFGGFSSLAVDGGTLVALNDIGVVARFAKPGTGRARVAINELPSGPGRGGTKGDRDSEALLRDPLGRGWWVAFENKHQLWLYDRSFGRALQRVDFGVKRWPHNGGIEGLAADGRELLLVPEDSGALVRWGGGTARAMPAAGRRQMSEAANLPGGGILLVERRPTGVGFRNALVRLERGPRGYRIGARIPLGVGAFDNVEALAVEPRPRGAVRLWLMTDDNFMRAQRTLLVALEAPAGTWR